MNDGTKRHTGGCLCGALRYEAEGEPLYAGYCYCTDRQKASGSGFIPFMGFCQERRALHRRNAAVPLESRAGR
jgi:hypothetical protein